MLFKLLAEGKLYAADENTNKILEIYCDILKILRLEKNSNREYCREKEVKVINADTGDLICSVPIKMFIEHTDKMLTQMKAEMMYREDKCGAFELPEVWSFAESISCQSLKAKSQDKADIFLMVHDIMSGRDDTFGFSIKSQLGSPSTLFIASGATNFIYTITKRMLTQGEMTHLTY